MKRLAMVPLVLLLAAGCAPRPVGRRMEVVMQTVRFTPDTLRAAPGDTLVWLNHDLFPHTSTDSGRGGWDTGTLEPGDSTRTIVHEAGEYSYWCTFHPTMRGILIVH